MRRIITSTAKKFWATLSLLSIELIIILVLFVASAFVFAFFVNLVFVQKKEDFDFMVFGFLEPFVSDGTTRIVSVVTYLGNHQFLIPANLLLVFYYLFIKKHRWYSIKIPVVALSSLLLMIGLKRFFNRPRPDIPVLREVSGLSFPSGHSMMSFTFYGLLIYIVWHEVQNKTLKWILISLLSLTILTIGATRVYLRVHYASDVLAGFSFGLIWLVISLFVIRRVERYTRKEIDPAVQKPTVVNIESKG